MRITHHVLFALVACVAASAVGCASETAANAPDAEESLPTDAESEAAPDLDPSDVAELTANQPQGAPMAEAEDGSDLVANAQDAPHVAEVAGLGLDQIHSLSLEDWDAGPAKCRKIAVRAAPDPTVCVQAFVRATTHTVEARGYLWTNRGYVPLRSGKLHVWLIDSKGRTDANTCSTHTIEAIKPGKSTGYRPYYCSASSTSSRSLSAVTYFKFDILGDGKGSYTTSVSTTGSVHR